MLLKVGKHPDNLVPTNIAVIDFSGSSTPTRGLVTLGVKVGSSERNTVFVVVPSKASYNALLGRDWIRGVGAVPSTVHQSVLLWTEDGKPEVVKADSNLYVEQLHVDFRVYSPKLKPLNVDRALNSYNCEGCYLSSEEVHCVENKADVNPENDQVHFIPDESVDFSFDCIYDLEPLGFEKHSVKDEDHLKGFESQDPLEEINLGSLDDVQITYICKDLVDPFRTELFHLLHEFKDCFAWNYHEMPGLNRSLVEHRLALKSDARPVKQTPQDDVSKTAFRYPGALSTYEWVVMPFGLKNAGATYQRAMNAIFHEYIGRFMKVYINDVMVKSILMNQHIDHLRKAFVMMRKKGLKMNPLKCVFGVSAGNFLGFVVHKKGIAIDKSKADAILALSAPKSKKEVQSFLGKVNYLRKFISNLSDRTRVFAPLVKLKNDSQFEWTREYQQAFDSIKTYLSKALIMVNVRPHEPLKLYITASTNTIGCMLAQDDENGHERPVYYLSRVLTDIETSYIFDGSKHKDGAGVGILIISLEGIPSEFLFELKYPCSNNMAEYEALILGLEILIRKGALKVQILGDSQLVLKQLSKEFKYNNEKLQKYLATAWELLTAFQKVSLVHIPRIHNEIANELAQIALRYRIGPETLRKLAIHDQRLYRICKCMSRMSKAWIDTTDSSI
ncbi:uncharacterized protein [Arachis hypogaea]|uniref:uncharacterized protein n=1 Tax=Arachis hypogaea TaxID=3818 RepID=UPI003B2228EA